MAYLIAGCFCFALVFVALRYFTRARPSDLAQAVRTFIGVFSALAGSGLLLAGRWGFAAIAIVAAVMALRSLRRVSGPIDAEDADDPDVSEVVTNSLKVRLNRHTREIDGEVLAGSFEGRRLSDLTFEELIDLLAEIRLNDPGSQSIVETYLDLRDPNWRDREDSREGHRGDPGSSSGGMDDQTALDILGLASDATVDDIKKAHRKLLAKLHPDHGGSNFIAQQINEAKAHLLRSRGGT